MSTVVYDEENGRTEKLKSLAINEPIPFKHLGKSHKRIYFYRGSKNEIFWFSEKDSTTIRLYILRMDKEEPRAIDI